MINNKHICSECIHWEVGDYWCSGSKHGIVIECKGWCLFKPNKRKRWNYHPACKDFNKAKRNGFTVSGKGEPTIDQINTILTKINNLIYDE